MAATWDKNTIRLYVNGNEVRSKGGLGGRVQKGFRWEYIGCNRVRLGGFVSKVAGLVFPAGTSFRGLWPDGSLGSS